MASPSFAVEMRKATKDVHALSDALVNAKLLFALSNNNVWAEGLMIFYEIFRFLEEAMERHPQTYLGQFNLDNISRTEAFKKDLDFYLGEDWTKSYEVRTEVAEYLVYLQKLEKEDCDLLIAYVYHLYLGLLSGGQILIRKKQIKDKLFRRQTKDGYAVTYFNGVSPGSLKKQFKDVLEEIALKLSLEKKLRILDESRKVFEWNNKIIKTVKGANEALVGMLMFCLIAVIILYFAVKFFF